MHHAQIVREKDVSLLEVEIQADSAIIQHLPDQVSVMLASVGDADLVGAVLGHPLVPWLVPSDARLSGRGVVDDER